MGITCDVCTRLPVGRLPKMHRGLVNLNHPELPFHTLSFDEMFKHPVPFGKFLAQASSLAIPGRP